MVVLVHRPLYDDWSFPKGKLDPGETEADAAIREVYEETTVFVELGELLGRTKYVDRKGRSKTAAYFAMTIKDGEPCGSNEVDKSVWLNIDEARDVLSYPRDLPLLDALVAHLGP